MNQFYFHIYNGMNNTLCKKKCISYLKFSFYSMLYYINECNS